MATAYKNRGVRHEHRLVAEQKLGRPLRPGEVVHHIDGDSRNNAPGNLEVLASQAEHARLHFLGAKRPPRLLCKNGHPLSADNVLITSIGRRRCLTCTRAYDNEWKKNQRRARGLKRPGGTSAGAAKRSRDTHGRFI